MVPKRKPFRPSETTLDLDDGRTSTLEKAIVWLMVCAAVSEICQLILMVAEYARA